MKFESVFWFGLAAAVAFLIAIFALFTVAIGVTVWRNVIRKPKPTPIVSDEFDKIVEAARMGGSQVGDNE